MVVLIKIRLINRRQPEKKTLVEKMKMLVVCGILRYTAFTHIAPIEKRYNPYVCDKMKKKQEQLDKWMEMARYWWYAGYCDILHFRGTFN